MEAPITMTFDELEDILRPLLQQHLQARSVTGEDTAAMEADVQEANVGPALENLRKLIENHARSTQGLEELQGVPLPEVDEQLRPLQQEIDAVLQRLAGASGLRQTVPGFMASALEQQLKELRPPEDTADQTAAADAADTQQLEVAQQLHMVMKDALNKLPALRARLEEMEVRLGRNLAACDIAQARAEQPPATVERVLRGVAAGRGLTAAGEDIGAEDKQR